MWVRSYTKGELCNSWYLSNLLAYCTDINTVRSQSYLLLVIVNYGSYLRVDRYPNKVVDQFSDMQVFFGNHFVQILYLYYAPKFLECRITQIKHMQIK